MKKSVAFTLIELLVVIAIIAILAALLLPALAGLHAPERDEVTALVEDRMKNALALDVPVVVEIGAGANWLEAH